MGIEVKKKYKIKEKNIINLNRFYKKVIVDNNKKESK